MEPVKIQGTLPVPIVILKDRKAAPLREVELSALTVEQSLRAQTALKEGQFIGIGELAAQVVLVDASGERHALSYEQLAATSRQNWEYLQALRAELDAKERAAS